MGHMEDASLRLSSRRCHALQTTSIRATGIGQRTLNRHTVVTNVIVFGCPGSLICLCLSANHCRVFAMLPTAQIVTILTWMGTTVLSSNGPEALSSGDRQALTVATGVSMVDASCQKGDCPLAGGCYEGTLAFLSECILSRSPVVAILMPNPIILRDTSCTSLGFHPLKKVETGTSAPDACHSSHGRVSFFANDEHLFWERVTTSGFDAATACPLFREIYAQCDSPTWTPETIMDKL